MNEDDLEEPGGKENILSHGASQPREQKHCSGSRASSEHTQVFCDSLSEETQVILWVYGKREKKGT